MAWNFRQGGATESPQNAAIKEFSKHIFESIVREAIQNSLDNPMPETLEPVRVVFEFDKIPIKDVPEYDDLLRRYKASKSFWDSDLSYKPIFDAVDERLENFAEEIPYLTISDFNTTGMSLNPASGTNIRMSSYYAFTRGNNTVKADENSGGSEGQGKATFFAASALRSIFVHTVSEHGSVYEGLTRMPTHTWEDGEEYAQTGHLYQDIDKPIYEEKFKTSLPFRRSNNEADFGSSISILGLWAYEEVSVKMIKATINNFWLAIHEGNLIVQVGDTTINQENIESLIEVYLPERTESTHTKGNPTEYGRARCYYETWTSAEKELTETYIENVELLGQCILRISQDPEYPGKIEFFRKQKMLINRSSQNTYISKGYCGVFICSDDQGNQLLRKMEGKTHTEWDPKLPMVEEDKKRGALAIKNINLFLKNSWQDYRKKHYPDSVELNGLAGISGVDKKNKAKSVSGTNKSKTKIAQKLARPKVEFEKTGVIKTGFKSVKEPDGTWKYVLSLHSNEAKEINIKMLPASDASRFSNDDILEVVAVTEGWSIANNAIYGELSQGVNTIEFNLNIAERLALDFKLK